MCAYTPNSVDPIGVWQLIRFDGERFTISISIRAHRFRLCDTIASWAKSLGFASHPLVRKLAAPHNTLAKSLPEQNQKIARCMEHGHKTVCHSTRGTLRRQTLLCTSVCCLPYDFVCFETHATTHNASRDCRQFDFHVGGSFFCAAISMGGATDRACLEVFDRMFWFLKMSF